MKRKIQKFRLLFVGLALMISGGFALAWSDQFETDVVTRDGYMADLDNPLITDAWEQLYGEYGELNPCCDLGEGSEWALLGEALPEDIYNRNYDNFWHSDWHSGTQEPGSHYLQVKMTDSMDSESLIAFVFKRRPASNDHTIAWLVMGTDDPEAVKEDCEEIAYVETPFSNNNETLMSTPFKRGEYQYLRFYSEAQQGESYGSRGYFHMSRFNIFPAVKMEDITMAKIAAQEAYNKYANYYDEYWGRTGDMPGDYSEEAVEAFQRICDSYNDLYFDDVDALNQFVVDIQNSYEAIASTKVPFKNLPSGYYRIRAGMDYWSGAKYMMGTIQDGLWATWTTPDFDSPKENLQSLWKITAVTDDSYDVVNMYNGGRFWDVAREMNAGLTDDPNYADGLLAFDAAGSDHDLGISYVNIRKANQPANDFVYVHQGGHSNGNGESGSVVGWCSTFNYGSCGASEWYFEEVPEDEAIEIIKAYDPEFDVKEDEFKNIMTSAPSLLSIAKDVQSLYEKTMPLLSYDNPATSPCSDSTEGQYIEYLWDNDSWTFWHSSWHGEYTIESHHYLQVEITDPQTYENCVFKYTRRNTTSGNQIDKWSVWGTNTDFNDDPEMIQGSEGLEKLADIVTPYHADNNTETYVSSLFETKGYKYIRFYCEGTRNNDGSISSNGEFFHAAEFQVYPAQYNPNVTSQYEAMGDVATNLDNLVNACADLEYGDIDNLTFLNLKNAYDAFVEVFVDPTNLRAAIAAAEIKATELAEPEKLNAMIAEAKTYDQSGAYTQERTGYYIEVLRLYSEGDLSNQRLYELALQRIQDGGTYRIFTEVNGNRYYLNLVGKLVDNTQKAATFTFNIVEGELYEYGFHVDGGNSRFTNPPGTYEEALKCGFINTTTDNRNTWDAQVFFMSPEGRFAVRSTNTPASESGWGWTGSAYWTVEEAEDGELVAQYSFDQNFIWQIEEYVDMRPDAWAKTQTWAYKLQLAAGLVTDASQFNSNAKEDSEGSYEALIDGDYYTFFHSQWSGMGPEEDHYLQVELPEAQNEFYVYFKKRSQNNNNRPTNINVSGSNDGENFTEFTVINEGLPTVATAVDYMSDKIYSDEAYKFLRFTVTDTNNGGSNNDHVFFTFSEFYILSDNELVDEAKTYMVPDYTDLNDWDVERINSLDNQFEMLGSYYNALAAIEDGTNYSIFTDIWGERYYLTANGTLTTNHQQAGAFTFIKVAGEEFPYGFKVKSEDSYFSNAPGTYEDVLHCGYLNKNADGRDTWEAQVFFLNDEGKFAVRSTNAAYTTSGWGWIGSAYWTVSDYGEFVAEYSFDKNFIWQLEDNTIVDLTYNLVIDGEVVATETGQQAVGFVPTAPAAFNEQMHSIYSLIPDVEVVSRYTAVVNFTPVWSNIIEFSQDLDNAKWYNMNIRSGWQVFKCDYEPYTMNGNPTIDDLTSPEYQWAFMPVEGEPFQVIIYNQATGADQTLANDNGNVVMREGVFKWEIFGNYDGFVLRPAEGEDRENMWVNQNGGGGSDRPLQFWNSTSGRTDNGSTFRVSEAPAPLSDYDRALASIESGAIYRFSTVIEGVRYYLDDHGYLVDSKKEAATFNVNMVYSEGEGEYENGYQIEVGGRYFTNAPGTYEEALYSGHISQSTSSRYLWEAQVFFKNKEGKYAIRSTNAPYYDSGWSWIGSAYWTVDETEDGDLLAQYSFDKNYIWELEKMEAHEVYCYLVMDGEIVAEEWIWQATEATPMAPQSFNEITHGLYMLTPNVDFIASDTYEVYFTATWGGPFQFSENFDDAKWYNMTIRSDYWVSMDDSEPYYPSYDTDLAIKESQWAFMPVEGDPYRVKIYNRAAGPNQTLAQDGDNVVMREGEFEWSIYANEDGFVICPPWDDWAWVNQYGGSAGPLQFWYSYEGKTDDGSTFRVTEAPEPVGPAILLGDANCDDAVDVVDVTTTVDFILGKAQPSAVQFKNTDVNKDGDIDVVDLTSIVSIILGNYKPVGTPAKAPARIQTNDVLLIDGSDLALLNGHQYVAFQMDVTLADGAELKGVQLSQRAADKEVTFRRMAGNTYRILAYSLDNTPFTDNEGNLFSLRIAGNQQTTFSNILFSDGIRAYTLSAEVVTSINGLAIDTQNATIYDLNGRKLNKVQKGGIYVINGKRVAVK